MAEKLSSGLRFLALRDVQKIFGLSSLDSARALLNHFDPPVPTFTYIRKVEMAAAVGAPPTYTEFPEEKVLAMSLELAMFSYMLPGGPGIHLDANVPPAFTSLPEGTRQLTGALRVIDYWGLFRENPHALQLMVALSALMYGPQDMKELLKRLWALGDFIAQQAVKPHGAKTKGSRVSPRRKPKHEQAVRDRRLAAEDEPKPRRRKR